MKAACVTNIHSVELSYLGLAGLEFRMNLHKLSLNNPLGSDNYVKKWRGTYTKYYQKLVLE